ncbi:unnamed protein product [Ilex paraguariensis]|uniref:Uncharacterized protein n=1 Tax=Ilex paraguariensis TaxID=185542 RepID=A0ABC8UL23_9AQUA
MPLSPVNTNPLNNANSMNTKVEPTNFMLPTSYAEDDKVANAITLRGPLSDQFELRQHLGEQRNDRFQSGVTSGTLDAIRERMKSIQFAAAAGNPESGNRSLITMSSNATHGLPSQFPLAT